MNELRRLAAIVSADVAGYSWLMGQDEAGTLAALKAILGTIIDPNVEAHGGRLVKATGDGLLLEFRSVVDALRCMIEVQSTLHKRGAGQAGPRIDFRVGINLGDVIVDGDDIFGDGVNVAARLQQIAAPGGIAVSGDVHTQIGNRIAAVFTDGGEQVLKNILRPVRVWHWTPGTPEPVISDRAPALALPDKPSIAVLAFANMSGDPEQEYFCDGVSEDIITELSRFRSLFVIARNSSFSYKGKSPDIRQVGRELGVHYVLEGSIRRAGNRIRVNGQLIDASTASHIWAERYDRVLEDIFAVQEELTRSIVRAIAPQIEAAEQERLRRRRPASLGAYEIAARAWAKAWEAFVKADRPLREAALADARTALGIDARSAFALNAVALAQWQHIVQGTADDRDAALREGMAAAEAAIAADRSDSNAYSAKARLLVYAGDRDRIDEALSCAREGHALNPHNMVALLALAYIENMAGDYAGAVAHLEEALRLSPRDPVRYLLHLQGAQAGIGSGQYAQAVQSARLGIGEAPGFPLLHVMLSVALVGQGEIGQARAALDEARRLGPRLVADRLAQGFPYRQRRHRERAMTFLRIAAGLDDPAAAEAHR